ncbi:MAG: hypothetical protein H0W42_02170 [Gemmatimonadaceae bacterium]|nr:hypothetical protein [Gemmatimonadaceae bacterium]
MRRSLITLLAAVFAMACADMPTTPLLTAADASFDRAPAPDYPPPPFAVVDGSASTEHGTFSFTGHFFANKPGNVAWLQFQSTTTEGVTFSSNARIQSVNGKVSGTGTIAIGGNTIYLRDIETFTYQTYRTPSRSISFSGGSIRQGGAVGPNGGGIDCSEVCFDQ